MLGKNNEQKTIALKHSYHWLSWQRRIFYLLLSLLMIGLGGLSYQHQIFIDWTRHNTNSLDPQSIALLEVLQQPVQIYSFTNKGQLKKSIERLISVYQRHYDNIQLEFIDPSQQPDLVREYNISVDGELVILMGEKQEHLSHINEENLSNALYRLARSQKRRLIFISGHGERSIHSKANFALSTFASSLNKQGFELVQKTIFQLGELKANRDILIIADPKADWLKQEVSQLIYYLKQGISLLWLAEPLDEDYAGEYLYGLSPLSEYLGIELLAGVVVDSTTHSLQLPRPDYAIISDYINHGINENMAAMTIFPQALAIDPLPVERTQGESFAFDPFLLTIEQSWIETSPIEGTIVFDEDADTLGPLTIGVSLTRSWPLAATKTKQAHKIEPAEDSADENQKVTKSKETTEDDSQLSAEEAVEDSDVSDENPSTLANESSAGSKQIILVLGDGDFLSNAFIANGGNLELGSRLMNWLSKEENFMAIPARQALDKDLALSESQLLFMAIGFFIVLPFILLLAGLSIRWRRRNKESQTA